MSGCAAKLERTGFGLRNVWPHVKHYANEQSANLAQSANESGFVRKNSQKVEAATSGAGSRPTNVFARGARAAAHQRLSSRRLTQEFLSGALQTRARQISAGSRAEPQRLRPPLVALLPQPEAVLPKEEPRSKGGISIEELISTASEKYELNRDFWGKYTDIPSMAQATDKHDILQITENFVLIHRKHVYLFQRLKNTVLKNLEHWSAPDLAALCHAWAQLGFLHEDLCVAMAGRVTATAHTCNAQELCWLMDAYATARCTAQSATQELAKQSLSKLEDFTLSQLCLHASSFARLNIHHGLLFKCIAERLEAPGKPVLSARDLTLAAYSFAKLGFHNPRVFEAIARGALEVVRDFTARDLQMLLVALVRAQHWDTELLDALSLQANRRIAQFSAESLTLMLRSLAFFHMGDSPLFTRAVVQLPRMILHFRPADVTTLLNAFAAVQVHSVALFDVVTPFIMEKATFFTPADWLGALRSYSALGCRDAAFLSALRIHLAASKLSLGQLCAAMVDCSRLSFSGLSESLVEAAAAKVSPTSSMLTADAAAQMYTALLLLGHTAGGAGSDAARGFLAALAQQLRDCIDQGQLSPATCASLCYATMLAPPVKSTGADGRHPLDASVLLERCLEEAASLSSEDRLVLRLVSQALELLPWNRHALQKAQQLETLAAASLASGTLDPPLPFFLAAAGHLAPHLSLAAWPARDSQLQPCGLERTDQEPASGEAARAARAAQAATLQGVFVAREIQAALQDISSALRSQQIQHELVLDLKTEAHISIPRVALQPPEVVMPAAREVAVLWGSTVHYVREEADPTVGARLSPAARFQVSLLQGLHNVDVVVVPHWRWPWSEPADAKAQVLVALLADAGAG